MFPVTSPDISLQLKYKWLLITAFQHQKEQKLRASLSTSLRTQPAASNLMANDNI